MDSEVTLVLLVKIGGAQNQSLAALRKEIWDYVLTRELGNISEYLPE